MSEKLRLHGAIMNIECKGPALPFTVAEQLAYKLGHRDARHAAAELALATQPQAPQGAVTGWIDIDERLPESGVRVLVMLADPEDTGWVVKTPWIALYMNGYWHDCDAIMDGCEITHWMHLPAAPETPEGDKQ